MSRTIPAALWFKWLSSLGAQFKKFSLGWGLFFCTYFFLTTLVYRCCRKNTFPKYYNYILKYNFSQLRLQLRSLTILAVKQLPRELLGYRKAAAASSVNYFISHGELQAQKAPLATSSCLLRKWHSCEALSEQSWKLQFYSYSSLWATAGSRPNAKTTEGSGELLRKWYQLTTETTLKSQMQILISHGCHICRRNWLDTTDRPGNFSTSVKLRSLMSQQKRPTDLLSARDTWSQPQLGEFFY